MTELVADEESSILKEEFIDFCNNFKRCKSIIRLKLALHFYQELNINNDKDQDSINETDKRILEHFNDTNRYIISDYHHVLLDHLDCNSKHENNQHFEFINKSIAIKCNISECPGYIRNNRDRQREKNKKLKHDKDALFYIDLLDTMHCYLVHSEDIGFRLKKSLNDEDIKTDLNNTDEAKQYDNDENIEIDIDIETKTSYIDENIKSMQKTLISKRRELSQIRGLERIQNNKYLTNLNCCNVNSNTTINKETDKVQENKNDDEQTTNDQKIDVDIGPEIDIEADEDDIEAEEQKGEAGQYHFGYRYYYWDYFKWNKDDDWQYNPGYRYCDWYITRRYKNLKKELLNNGLDINNYNETTIKAQNLFRFSSKIKEICSDFGWKKDYGIGEDQAVTLQHIMVVLFYTDYSKLSYEFSKTFRRISSTESDKSLKRRNSVFWNWSKLLRETVEVYGTKLYQSNTKIFYHGVSKIYFTSFVANFCGPTSTTASVEVATIFSSEKGVILELEQVQNQRHLKCFNCSFLSAFGNEDERLFIGGQFKLQFRSILLMDTHENCQLFAKSLLLFDRAIIGHHLDDIEKKGISSYDYKIVNKLIKWHMSDDINYKCNFPNFIIVCFKKFIRNKKLIKINSDHLRRDYGKKFCNLLLNETIQNLVKFDFIAKIFLNCNEIHSEQTGDITPKYLSELLKMIREINENEWVILNTIYLENIEEMPSYLFVSLFKAENWQIIKKDDYTLKISKIELQRSYSELIWDGITRMVSYTH